MKANTLCLMTVLICSLILVQTPGVSACSYVNEPGKELHFLVNIQLTELDGTGTGHSLSLDGSLESDCSVTIHSSVIDSQVVRLGYRDAVNYEVSETGFTKSNVPVAAMTHTGSNGQQYDLVGSNRTDAVYVQHESDSLISKDLVSQEVTTYDLDLQSRISANYLNDTATLLDARYQSYSMKLASESIYFTFLQEKDNGTVGIWHYLGVYNLTSNEFGAHLLQIRETEMAYASHFSIAPDGSHMVWMDHNDIFYHFSLKDKTQASFQLDLLSSWSSQTSLAVHDGVPYFYVLGSYSSTSVTRVNLESMEVTEIGTDVDQIIALESYLLLVRGSTVTSKVGILTSAIPVGIFLVAAVCIRKKLLNLSPRQ